jgi:acetoin utilization deacetylase AcuC-like enzyme
MVTYRAAGPSESLIKELCEGFCLYNTVAVAALLVWASRMLQIEIALVLLTGNGIEHILFDRSDIMYISLHRYVQKQHFAVVSLSLPDTVLVHPHTAHKVHPLYVYLIT